MAADTSVKGYYPKTEVHYDDEKDVYERIQT